jgi:hypothetical protein
MPPYLGPIWASMLANSGVVRRQGSASALGTGAREGGGGGASRGARLRALARRDPKLSAARRVCVCGAGGEVSRDEDGWGDSEELRLGVVESCAGRAVRYQKCCRPSVAVAARCKLLMPAKALRWRQDDVLTRSFSAFFATFSAASLSAFSFASRLCCHPGWEGLRGLRILNRRKYKVTTTIRLAHSKLRA